MSDVRVDINYVALSRLLFPAVEKVVEDMAARCNATLEEDYGYVGDVIMTDRPHGAVRAVSPHAHASNRVHNTILKNVGSL